MTYQSFEPCTVVNINTFLEKVWVKEVRNVTKKILRDNSKGITKPAKRGGVKLISGLIYEETCWVVKIFSKTLYTKLWHTLNMPNARRRPPRCTALETEEWRTDMTEKL